MAGPLDTPQVTPGQDDKEVTINDGNLHQDNASNTYLSIAMTDADYVLSAAEQQENIFLTFTGTLTADRNIDLLASKHRQMTIQNSTTGGFDLFVRYAAGGSAVIVPAGEMRTIQGTGADVVEVSGGGGAGGGGAVSVTSAISSVLVRITSDQATTDNAFAPIDWDVAVYDPNGVWSGANPSRIPIPAGISQVKAIGNASFTADASGSLNSVKITKTGVDILPRPRAGRDPGGAAADMQNISTAMIPVVGGTDYLELEVFHNMGAGDGVLSGDNATWFYVEFLSSDDIATGQTTDATATVIWSLPLAAGEHGNVTAQCSAKKSTDDESYTTTIQNSALNIAGTTTEQGSGEEVIAGPRSVGTPGAVSFKLIVNNTDDRIDLEWTGIAAETWDVLAVMTVTKL